MDRRFFALAIAIALFEGCGDVIDPVVETEDRRIVVVPMKDGVQHYFESERGIRLARAVTAELQAARKARGDEVPEVVPIEQLALALGDVDVKDLQPGEIGRRAKADLVVLGDITLFETRRAGDVGFFRGQASVLISIVDTARPEHPIAAIEVKASFPPEGYRSWGGLAATEGGEREIEQGLTLLLAKRIAQLFYPHEPEKE